MNKLEMFIEFRCKDAQTKPASF